MKADEASSTAYTVSQGIVYSGRYSPDRQYVPEPLLQSNELILKSSRAGRKLLRQLSHPLYRMLLRIFERLTLPGMAFHYVLRKTYIERCVRQAIDSGAKQVIVLGAGFDTLDLRLSHEFSSVVFIEVDHPATSQAKLEALNSQSRFADNYHFVAIDFSRESLYESLHKFHSFDKFLHSIFVCEGVLMYLSGNDVGQLLENINQLTNEKKNFIFTSLEPLESSSNDSGFLLRLYLRLKHESLGWTCSQEMISAFLSKYHYQKIESVGDCQIAKMIMPDIRRKRFHRGEYVVNAISENS